MITSAAVATLLAIPEHEPLPDWHWFRARTPTGYDYHVPTAAEVCDDAGVELDAGVLACAAASEFPGRYPTYLLAGLACIINDATALYPDPCGTRGRQAILNRVTRAKLQSGYFGRQSGRWCSSFQAPTRRTLEAARMALQGIGAELAHDGRRWVDCKVQDSGKQAGRTLEHDAEAILRSRYADGWHLVPPTAGIDQYVLAILARHGVSLDAALAVLADGRLRWGRAS